MSIAHPLTDVNLRLTRIDKFAREQQAATRPLPTRYPSCTHLVPALTCYRCEHEHIYRFPYRLTDFFTDPLQIGYRSVTGRFQAPPATVTPRNGGTAA